MKKSKIYITIILLCTSYLSKGQLVQGDLEINTPLASNKSVMAKSVTIKPGFSSNGYQFHAKTNSGYYNIDNIEENNMDRNYVRVVIPKVAIQNMAEFNYLERDKVIEQIEYTDGLGRTLQSQIMGVGNTGEYMMQAYSYDKFGRVDTSYLPFTSETEGMYLDGIKSLQKEFYLNSTNQIATDNSPFSKVTYKNSPLSQVEQMHAQGEYWKTKPVSTQQETNQANVVRKWSYDATTGNYVSTEYYNAGTLYKNTVIDENQLEVTTYTDKQGRTILNNQEGLLSYYIYDYRSRLVHMLPPEFVEQLAAVAYTIDPLNELVKQYCYTYIYDNKSRLLKKRLPGIKPIEYIYDNLNRLVLSRNGELTKNNRWSFVKYDKLGRIACIGLWTDSSNNTPDDLQTIMDNETDIFETFDYTAMVYTKQVFPVNTIDVHTMNVYDRYYAGMHNFAAKEGFDQLYMSFPKGMLTYSKVKVLDGSNTYLENTIYYNKKGQVLQNYTGNILGNTDISHYSYNFMGQIEEVKIEHAMPNNYTEDISKYYTYDEGSRLKRVEQEIGADNVNGRVTLLELEYNKLGQVSDKKIHKKADGSFLQNIDYKYNIRGWLTEINDPNEQGADNDLFAMHLHYNDVLAGGTTLNNGLITGVEWNVFGQNAKKRAYNYTYDNLYRLTAANYMAGTNLTEDVGRYNTAYTYSANGKIQTLKRWGIQNGLDWENPTTGLIDDLVYTYSGNQIQKVDDITGTADHTNHFLDKSTTEEEYRYDDNGNMYFDANKNLQEISYNHLNLPETVYFDPQNHIEFIYDAVGKKLEKIVTQAGTATHYKYVGSFIYVNGVAQQFATEEGRVVIEGSTYSYEYFLKDYLGSVRVMFKEGINGQAEILQESHYYPYGMRIEGLCVNGETNNRLFGGKEFMSEINLDWYDFSARNYDAQLGTWFNVDPMLEKYNSITPYNYCFNNPVNFTDPSGMDPFNDEVDKVALFGKDAQNWHRRYISSRNYTFGNAMSIARDIYNSSGGIMVKGGKITRKIMGRTLHNFKGNYTNKTQRFLRTILASFMGGKYSDSNKSIFRLTTTNTVYVGNGEQTNSNQSGQVNESGNAESNENAQSSGGDGLFIAGMAFQAGGLFAEGAGGTLNFFQVSNQGVRAAAIRNNIPIDVIDDIMSKTGNLTNLSKWAGRGFIAAGVVVNVIDGVNAYNQGDMNGVTRAGMDMVAGLGAAAVGGPIGIIMYGSYMIIMNKPIMPSGPDPLPAYPADNTYVAPRY